MGIKFSKKADGNIDNLCEINPILSYDGEGLEEFAKRFDKPVDLPFFLEKWKY